MAFLYVKQDTSGTALIVIEPIWMARLQTLQ